MRYQDITRLARQHSDQLSRCVDEEVLRYFKVMYGWDKHDILCRSGCINAQYNINIYQNVKYEFCIGKVILFEVEYLANEIIVRRYY